MSSASARLAPLQASSAAAYALRIVTSSAGTGFLSTWSSASEARKVGGEAADEASATVSTPDATLTSRKSIVLSKSRLDALSSVGDPVSVLACQGRGPDEKEANPKDERACPWPTALEITGATVVVRARSVGLCTSGVWTGLAVMPPACAESLHFLPVCCTSLLPSPERRGRHRSLPPGSDDHPAASAAVGG